MKQTLFGALLLVFIAIYPLRAEEQPFGTVAGNLEYLLNENTSQCEFFLDGKPILTLDCDGAYLPAMLGDFRGNYGDIEQVVFFQELPMGNACNGGPLHLFGFRKNKSYLIAGPIDFCGGADPVIENHGSSIAITFPGGTPNKGDGNVPTEIWRFQNGEVVKIQ